MKRKKKRKMKKFPLNRADKLLSAKIRQRDGRCLFPGCHVTELAALQCSHYIGRANKSTRFDEDNCISLCWLHHFKDKMLGFEYQKQTIERHGWDGQYTLFMKAHLGEEGFRALQARAEVKISQKKAIAAFMEKSFPQIWEKYQKPT